MSSHARHDTTDAARSALEGSTLDRRVMSPQAALAMTAWLLIGTKIILSQFPWIVQRGMALDGVLYSAIARNMSQGFGTFWHPMYTEAREGFWEHPPLGFFLQSLVFRLFGDHWAIDRLYSVATIVPLTFLIIALWRHLVTRVDRLSEFSWLVVGLWVSMVGWPWMYRHNILENTMAIFTTLAVYAALRASETSRGGIVWIALSAAAIVCAFLTKGPVALFPCVTPMVVWLTLSRHDWRKALAMQGMLVALLAVSAAALFGYPDSRAALTRYLQEQVFSSLQGQRELVTSAWGHFFLLFGLGKALGPPALAVVACRWAMRRRNVQTESRDLRGPLMFCTLTALSASLPILISPKQSTYYSAPSWPFYALALALWSAPAVAALANRWCASAGFTRANRNVQIVAGLAMICTVVVSLGLAGRICRDVPMIHDIGRIAQTVPPHAIVAVSPKMSEDWTFEAYLYRWHYISMQWSDVETPPLYRIDVADARGAPPPGYQECDAGLTRYRIYAPVAVGGTLRIVR